MIDDARPERPSKIQVRNSPMLNREIEQLKVRLETNNVSEIIRRSVHLHSRILQEEPDELYIVVDGRRERVILG